MEYDYKAAAAHIAEMRFKVREMRKADHTYVETGLPEPQHSEKENNKPTAVKTKSQERLNS